jgi:hypothetical protein
MPEKREMVPWTCGECLKVQQFEPEYDGDMPNGWFSIEDRGAYYVACSITCLKHFVHAYEEREIKQAQRVPAPQPEQET